MTAFYNEREPYAAQWLRNLIAAGHIAPGVVDERDIRDIKPDELAGYTQCHFFAGIGVWSLALRNAGWPDDKPVWTGSCPCQPFSAAGRRAGVDDERHLWPHWHHLIAQCRPPVVLGEQVASKDGLGWLDLVQADLEGAGYAVGASDLCAAGFSGAHIRQRLYFVGVADTYSRELAGFADGEGCQFDGTQTGRLQGDRELESGGGSGGLADANDARPQGWYGVPECAGERPAGPSGVVGGLADVSSERRDWIEGAAEQDGRGGAEADSGVGRLADTQLDGRRQVGALVGGCGEGSRAQGLDERSGDGGDERGPYAPMLGRHAVDWLFCRDGKWRPVEPGTFPLVDAAPQRVGRLRAYGNALDAETATNFVAAVMEAIPDCQRLLDESLVVI